MSDEHGTRKFLHCLAAHLAALPKWLSVLTLAAAASLPPGALGADEPAPALPAYQADLSQTSVSGLSSGAFMASQFAVAYSGTVIGAGIVAGGPYYCAGYPGFAPFIGYLVNAMGSCMNPAQANAVPPAANVSWSAAQNFASLGQIDPTEHIKRQRIYLFSGKSDQTVTTQVVDQTARFFQLAGVPADQVDYISNVNAGHAILIDKPDDSDCALTQPPFINGCGFVQSQDILRFIYGALNPPAQTLSGKLIAFNQRSFIHGALSSMSNTAYAYVPQSCLQQSCRVHIAFHGCEQGDVVLKKAHYYTATGYNQLADTNNIIVLYPQAEPSPLFPYNPKGCWDFWGYTSVNPFLPDFYTRSGVQMAAVKAMLDQLGAARPR